MIVIRPGYPLPANAALLATMPTIAKQGSPLQFQLDGVLQEVSPTEELVKGGVCAQGCIKVEQFARPNAALLLRILGVVLLPKQLGGGQSSRKPIWPDKYRLIIIISFKSESVGSALATHIVI